MRLRLIACGAVFLAAVSSLIYGYWASENIKTQMKKETGQRDLFAARFAQYSDRTLPYGRTGQVDRAERDPGPQYEANMRVLGSRLSTAEICFQAGISGAPAALLCLLAIIVAPIFGNQWIVPCAAVFLAGVGWAIYGHWVSEETKAQIGKETANQEKAEKDREVVVWHGVGGNAGPYRVRAPGFPDGPFGEIRHEGPDPRPQYQANLRVLGSKLSTAKILFQAGIVGASGSLLCLAAIILTPKLARMNTRKRPEADLILTENETEPTVAPAPNVKATVTKDQKIHSRTCPNCHQTLNSYAVKCRYCKADLI